MRQRLVDTQRRCGLSPWRALPPAAALQWWPLGRVESVYHREGGVDSTHSETDELVLTHSLISCVEISKYISMPYLSREHVCTFCFSKTEIIKIWITELCGLEHFSLSIIIMHL